MASAFPFIDRTMRRLRVHYALEGAANAPVVVLSNTLGTSLAMLD
jgi:hypothetical protein